MSSTHHRQSTGDALRNVTEAVSGLVREEVRRGEAEMKEKVKLGSGGAVLLGAAGVLGIAAAGTSTVLLVRILDRFLPVRAAALTATLLLGGAAAGCGWLGYRELKPALPLLPTETIQDLKDGIDSARTTASAEG
jgi:uncharacterized membrane protein YqjE